MLYMYIARWIWINWSDFSKNIFWVIFLKDERMCKKKGSLANNFYVTLNRFCLIGIPQSLFLTYNIKLDGIPSKIKCKIHACFIVYSSYKKLLVIKNYKIYIATSSSYCISFYISRYHFLQLFRTWFKIIYNKILSQISLF